MSARATLLLGLLLLSPACGGGGGGGGGTVTPPSHFTCSGAVAPGPDQVSLSCPVTSGSPILITVLIGGPTTSSDIYGIKFDLVFSPTIVAFQPPAIQGTFLNRDGAGTTTIAATPPADPGRVVASITRLTAPGGLQAIAAQVPVMSLSFTATGAAGSTSLTFQNAQAVDSSGAPIASVQFGPPLTLSFQ